MERDARMLLPWTTALLVLLCLSALAGCGPKEAAAPPESSAGSKTASSAPAPTGDGGAVVQPAVATGKPLGSLKVGGKAVCAVCSVKEGTKEEEEVKATLDYKGKTYGFCNDSEKAEFISNPAKYASK